MEEGGTPKKQKRKKKKKRKKKTAIPKLEGMLHGLEGLVHIFADMIVLASMCSVPGGAWSMDRGVMG